MAGNSASASASADLRSGIGTLSGSFSLDPRGASDDGNFLAGWDFVYGGPGAGPGSAKSGTDDTTHSERVTFDLDRAVGVAVGTFRVSASYLFGTGSVSASWTVFDAALERRATAVDGTSGKDIVLGGAGGDTIRTGEGNDQIDGGAGADELFGGAGDDLYRVAGADRVHEAVGEGIDRAIAATSYVLQAGQEVEILEASRAVDTSPIKLFGNERSQSVLGNAGDNVLEGRAGNDVLDGRAGADLLRGGYGNDRLDGGLGDDRLEGGAGDDRLAVSDGDDSLTGGSGRDSFDLHRPPSSGLTHITDFSPASDTLRLDRSAFPELGGTGVLSSDAFKDVGAAGATLDADDRILYDSRSGLLSYDADGSGAGDAVALAVLDRAPGLGHADILVV